MLAVQRGERTAPGFGGGQSVDGFDREQGLAALGGLGLTLPGLARGALDVVTGAQAVLADRRGSR